MAIASSRVYKDITRYSHSNGLVVLTQPERSLPIVSLRGSFRSGTSVEPPQKSGQTKLMAALLRSGTTDRSAMDIARVLDGMGSSISFNVHPDAIHFGLTCLSRHLPATWDILTDLVFHSTFPNDEVERQRRIMVADIKKKADQPSLIAWEVFNHFAYGEHPYARSGDGLEHTLSAITREELESDYRHRCRPFNAVVAVAGDVDSKDFLAMIDQSEWNSDGPHDEPAGECDEPVPNVRRIVLVDRDLTQANICLGNLGMRRRSSAYAASVMMNHILGGSGLVSRLTHTVRTRQGLAYSVYSSMTRRLHGGTFSVHMQTKTESAAAAIRLIESEMGTMGTEQVSDAEWSDARKYFKGSYPFKLESYSNLAFYLEQSEFHGLGLDALDRELDEVMNVNKEDIQQVAHRYLRSDQSTIVVTGKKDRLNGLLEPLGAVLEVDHPSMKESS